MPRSARARPRTIGGVAHHQATSSGPSSSTSSHQNTPPSTVAPTRCTTGETRSATGSTDSTKPPVAENHRKPTSRHRAGSRSHRTGRVAGLVPFVPAYPAGMRTPSRSPLTLRWTAVSAAVAGTTASARRNPTATSPSGTHRIDKMASASAGTIDSA
jgi:hypothetical protein